MVEEWDKLDSKPLADYRIFKSREDTRRSPRTGKIHTFYVLESNDWMNVIPLTAEGKVIFVHQFRHGTERVTMEVPGGLVETAEPPAETARRELLEETGYAGDQIIPIGMVEPNPAFLDNRCYSFLATNVRLIQKPQFDGTEDIVISQVPLDEVPHLIRNQTITHSLTIAAFYHLERYIEVHGPLVITTYGGNNAGQQ